MIKQFLFKIKARKAKYRILETRSVFIPQYLTFDWEGIDRNSNDRWYSMDIQIKRCSFESFDVANERLQNYLIYLDRKNHQEKEIIHLVGKRPDLLVNIKK